MKRSSPLDIEAVILAGGLGTRLRPALPDCPKALAPVAGRPFITVLLDQLAAAQFRSVTLLVGYRADQIQEMLGANHDGLSLTYEVEASPLGTAGALRRALPRFKAKTILVMNGDSFCDVDVRALADQHYRSRADLTIVVAQAPDTRRFGRVELTSAGKAAAFVEKSEGGPGNINAGIYLLERTLITEIPAGRPVSLERDMLPLWLGARRIHGFPASGRFLDIGTPADYAAAEDLLEVEARSCPLS